MLKTQLKEKLKLSEDTDLVDDVIETPADAEAVITTAEEPTEEVKNNAIYNIVSTELRDTLSDIENLKGIIANIDDDTEHADEIAETINTIIDERSVHVGMLETLLEKIDGKPAETDTTEDEYTPDSDPHSDLVDENLTEAKDRYKIEYWVDEDARDQGFGDIAIETFSDLEDAKEYADKLFGEVASVEVLDTQDENKVVYGRYPEDESLKEDYYVDPDTIKVGDTITYYTSTGANAKTRKAKVTEITDEGIWLDNDDVIRFGSSKKPHKWNDLQGQLIRKVESLKEDWDKIFKKIEKKYKGKRAIFTHLDEYDEEQPGLKEREGEPCDIIGADILDGYDDGGFESCYWSIEFDDGKKFTGIPGVALEISKPEEMLGEDKRLNYRNFYDRMKIKREQEKKAKSEKEKKTKEIDDGPEHGYASTYDYESAQKILDQMSDLRKQEAEKEHEIVTAWAVQKTMSDDEFHKQMKELHETTQAKEDELFKELTSLTDKAKNESVITEERLDDTEGDYTVEVYDIIYQEETDDNQFVDKKYDDKVTVTIHCENGEEDLEYGDVIEPAVEKAVGIWPWKYKYNIISRPEAVIPDGFVRFEGYATEVGDIGRELITRTGEHIWITDVTEDDYGFWASDDKSDIKTGRGHYYPSDRIKFVAEE